MNVLQSVGTEVFMGHPRGPNRQIQNKALQLPWVKVVTAGHLRNASARFEVYWLGLREKDPKNHEAVMKPEEWLKRFGKFLAQENGTPSNVSGREDRRSEEEDT